MKKFTSIIISIALSVTTICAMCSCAPQLPQLIYAEEAYFDYKIITDEDSMNIACIGGNGPLRETVDERHIVIYEPIEFTQTVEFSPVSDDELQNIATELFGDSYVLNENLFIYYFGEYHGYYALGIYCTDWPFPTSALLDIYCQIGNIGWERSVGYYELYIYTTPQKTKIK